MSGFSVGAASATPSAATALGADGLAVATSVADVGDVQVQPSRVKKRRSKRRVGAGRGAGNPAGDDDAKSHVSRGSTGPGATGASPDVSSSKAGRSTA